MATALLAISLNEQRLLPQHSPAMQNGMKAALNRAQGWLIQNSDRERARWKFNPLIADSSETESDSGLVLYALRNLAATEQGEHNDDFSHAWLQSLPNTFPRKTSEAEMSGEWFDIGATPTFDTVRHLKLPWLIMGTVVSYRDGTVGERVKALRLLEEAITKQNWGVGGTLDYQRAEILLAITELQRQVDTHA